MSLALTFFTDCPDASVAALHLTRAEGREALSEPYVYTLDLDSSEDQGLTVESIEAWLASRCHLTFGAAQVAGVIRDVTLLPSLSVSGEGVPRISYRATLVPTVERLSSVRRSRVFQEQPPLEVVAAVLTEHGIAHELATVAEYPWREYIVQYEETDLAFVSRLLEHWGVFYFFEQRDDGEVMILADDNRAFRAGEHATLRFASDDRDQEAVGWIGGVTRTHRPQTASVTLGDYNWRAPFRDEQGRMTARQLQLRPAHDVDVATGYGEHRVYGDHFKDEAEGLQLAKIRAEEMMVDRVSWEASARAPGLTPGHLVQTSGMPLGDLEQEYYVVETRTVLEAGAEHAVTEQRVALKAVAIPFRPRRRTAKPCIHGFMHAVVDGEVDSAAAPIDALGRYRLVMPFDQAAAPGGRASRWVRMAQASSGSEYGMHLPLHIGVEVAVMHVAGDPDRPVIVGSVPNVDTTSPVVDANATQSRIKTRGNIVFELEDDA